MTEDTLELATHALALATGDTAEVVVHQERSAFARIAQSRVYQPVLADDLRIQLRIVRRARVGTATTSRSSDDALRELARRARAAADHAPADPHLPELPAAAEYESVDGFDDDTAAMSAADLCALAHGALRCLPDIELFGYLTTGISSIAVASSTGLAASQTMTDAAGVALAAGEGMSGYADSVAVRWGDIDAAALVAEATEKARRTRNAATLDGGTYAAVLEPYAVGQILHEFGRMAFRAPELLDGTSYLAGRIGERVFHPELTVADDATDSRTLPKSFDAEGVPKRRVAIVEEGVARSVVWDRATAAQAGDAYASTGHAAPAAWEDRAPTPLNLMIGPGRSSHEELAAAVGDGIWITRVHYLSVVDQREGVITGMTRDGTFRIRDGRIAEPLVNLRFIASVPRLANELVALGAEPRLVAVDHHYEARYPNAPLVPALATKAFHIVGSGPAPGL